MRIQRETVRRVAAIVLGATTLFGSNAAADDVAGQVTASTGDVEGMEIDGSVGEGQHVRLGEDSACSILVDRDALMELCGQTSVVLEREANRRIVKLDRGEIRLVVEPRDIDARVEIHTPAAIVTLLGTVVHVSVDPVTGETMIASAESKVSVRSSNPDIRGSTVIAAAERVIVKRDEAPPARPVRLTRAEIDELGGCLIDFHSAALGRDRQDHDRLVEERLLAMDVSRNIEGGRFPSPPPRQRVPGDSGPPSGQSITGEQGVCVAPDCAPNFDENARDPS